MYVHATVRDTDICPANEKRTACQRDGRGQGFAARIDVCHQLCALAPSLRFMEYDAHGVAWRDQMLGSDLTIRNGEFILPGESAGEWR